MILIKHCIHSNSWQQVYLIISIQSDLFYPDPKNFKFFDWIIELLDYPIIQFLWKNQETGVYRIKYNKEEKIQKKNKCL